MGAKLPLLESVCTYHVGVDDSRTAADPLPGHGLSLCFVQHHHHILCHGVRIPNPLSNFLEADRRGKYSELEKLGPKYRVALMSECRQTSWMANPMTPD